MCTNPRKINRSGQYKEDNYHGKKGEDYAIEVFAKCGYCQECINEKANNWVIRNYYESQEHEKACFITLTYKENPLFLIKKHMQDFMKRFRKAIGKQNKNCRVFYCGEYGTLHKRPHKHAIIYGWEEEKSKLKYMGINSKGNVIFKSETVDKTWGWGRTTYQRFEKHEIPYITLYQTPQETESYEYRISKKNLDELLSKLKSKELNPTHRKQMIKECEKAMKEMEKNKALYYSFKEYNGWSIALGWSAFLKSYKKYPIYDWNEYIEDKEFLTPSPWVKKLANSGDQQAIKEMLFRTEQLISKGITEEELKNKNRINALRKDKEDKLNLINEVFIM